MADPGHPMAQTDDNRMELFIFPDGTAVEIFVFDQAPVSRRTPARTSHDHAPAPSSPPPESARRAESQAPPPEGVTVDSASGECPVCGGAHVFPDDWERNRDGDWNIVMRCPECETRRRIVLGREGVEALNRTLYRNAQTLAREADVLSRRNFEEEAAKLVEALALDLILPMDF